MRLRDFSILGLLPWVFGETIDLSRLSWSLANHNGSIVIPASIPSQVHMDLLKAGLITEPLLGINGMLSSTYMEVSNQAVVHRFHRAMDHQRQLDLYCGSVPDPECYISE
jgi:hypothetical protein